MQDPQLQAFRAQLTERLETLRLERAATAAERGAVTLDQTAVGRLSRMDAMQVQAMALANDQRREAEMARIEAALTRLARGSFGDCITCGEPIETRRLEIDPTSQRCIACMREG